MSCITEDNTVKLYIFCQLKIVLYILQVQIIVIFFNLEIKLKMNITQLRMHNNTEFEH